MAGDTLQFGAGRANTDVSRRGLIATMIAGSAAASAIMLPAIAAASSRVAWDAAFADMERTKALSDAAESRWNEAYERYKAIAPDEEAIDLSEFRFLHRRVILLTLNLDEYEQKVVAERGVTWRGDDEALQRRQDAIDAVRTWRAADQRATQVSGLSVAYDDVESACNVYTDAIDALLATPAPDLPALLWKLEYLIDSNDPGEVERSTSSWSPSFVAQTKADMRRLLGGEA